MLNKINKPNSKKTWWLCKCECGNICEARADALKSERKKSCGCLNKEKQQELKNYNIKDITNNRYGKLVAIKSTGKTRESGGSYLWECQCDCGNITYASVSDLNSGNTTSCGCTRESYGEQKIGELLIKNNIKFETQKTFKDLISSRNKKLKFDFYCYIDNEEVAIEFDGPQHYELTNFTTQYLIENDIIKNTWCLNNNIKLYRIPYTERNKIEHYSLLSELLKPEYLVIRPDFYKVRV